MPAANASACGEFATWIVLLTSTVPGSISVIVFSPASAAHTAPDPTANWLGNPPIKTPPFPWPAAGSIRDTVPSWLFATHNQFPSYVMLVGPLPTDADPPGVFDVGSIGTTVPLAPLATQTDPAPTVIPAGFAPAGIVASTVSVAGSIFETVPSSVFVTHTEPAPNAIAVGAFPTGIA